MTRSVAQLAIERPLYTWLLMIACLIGGIYGIENVGRLEDPKFPINTAYVITPYPGASAVEVEQEVTDVIEAALQQLPYLEYVESKSVPGRSEVQVELLEQYTAADLPQIWDELRRRIGETVFELPPGAGPSLVEDDFGDVYGMLYAVSAPGYSPADIADISRTLATQLKLVPGVAKVRTAGEPQEAVYVEIDQARLVSLGLPIDAVFNAIASENRVQAAGSVAYGARRLRLAPKIAFDSVDALGAMQIGLPGSTEIIPLREIAKVSRSPIETPAQIIKHNGSRVFTVGVSVVDGLNVVDIGEQVDVRLAELIQTLPVGVEVSPIYRQHVVVEAAINNFLKNLLLSVVTVIGALCLFMGWRAGTVVGSVLLLTVLGTLYLMALLGIELQRISLGALMIAMGMLVDNAIVVAEGMVIGVQRGQSPAAAATAAVRRTQYALLGATVIGILAFAPIGLARDASGHFLNSLFQVVAISLLLSWVLAITVAPLLGSYLLTSKASAQTTAVDDSALYRGWGYSLYRGLIRFSLRRWWVATFVILAITSACIYGFGSVKQSFFPTTNTPLFYVDYFLPQGTDIHTTQKETEKLAEVIREEPGVVAVTTSVGRGTARFTTTASPEQPNPAYGFFVIRVADVSDLSTLMNRVGDRLRELALDAELIIRRSEFTPAGNSKIEARFSGPDPDTLRHLADQALDIYLVHDLIDRKTDWRQREPQLVPRFNDTRARMAGVSRADVYSAIAFAAEGVQVGLFREHNKLLPIIARAPQDERLDLAALPDRTVWSPTQQAHVPMSHVISAFELAPVDGMILRRDRVRTLSALANGPVGHNTNRVFDRLRPEVEAIELPPGYALEWGGEFEASVRARTTLSSKIGPTFGIMFLITLLMFGSLREPIIIWLTIPMIVCGVVLSLLVTDLSFTFPSFLGLLSLSGMLVKNCVVLVDEINQRIRDHAATLEEIALASVSRLRPVMLAAGTTIAGMSPLLNDAFFREMAVCIMGGLAFATLLTLIALPVFYRIAFYREIRGARQQAERDSIVASSSPSPTPPPTPTADPELR